MLCGCWGLRCRKGCDFFIPGRNDPSLADEIVSLRFKIPPSLNPVKPGLGKDEFCFRRACRSWAKVKLNSGGLARFGPGRILFQAARSQLITLKTIIQPEFTFRLCKIKIKKAPDFQNKFSMQPNQAKVTLY